MQKPRGESQHRYVWGTLEEGGGTWSELLVGKILQVVLE